MCGCWEKAPVVNKREGREEVSDEERVGVGRRRVCFFFQAEDGIRDGIS